MSLKMAYKWKQIVLLVTIWYAIILFMQFIISRTTSDFRVKARRLRAVSIIITESLLGVASYIIWKILSPLPNILLQPQTAPRSRSMSRSTLRSHRNSDAGPSPTHSNEMNEGLVSVWTLWHYALVVFILLCHISYATNLFFIQIEPHWFGMLCYICLGIHLQCITGILLIKGISFTILILKRAMSPKFNHAEAGISYKNTILLLIFYVLFSSMTGLYTASQPPLLKYVDIPIRNLPEDLKRLRIAQLSDIHLGPTVGYSKLKMIIDIVQQEKPDVLVITGDLVDGSVKALEEASQPLRSVNPKYGKLFVTGNHEYYTGDVENWFEFLRSMNFKILHNSNLKIPQKSSSQHQICFAGTDDIQADRTGYGDHTFNIKKAVEGCNESLPIVLLAHQPIAAQKALDSGVRLDLILSGHTHGGQIFPFIFGAYLINPFYAGLYKIEGRDSHVYVSTGTQYWGIPMRIGTNMEITIITLQVL